MRYGLITGACLLLAACASDHARAPAAVGISGGPAANPTGSNGPMSGSPSNTNTGVPAARGYGSALNPTGSNGPMSGSPGNTNVQVPGTIRSAPAANPTGSNGPQSGQPGNMAPTSSY